MINLGFSREKKREMCIIAFEVVLICAIVLPILLLSLYTLPIKDDFANALRIKQELGNSGFLVTAIRITKSWWFSMGGYYSAMFLHIWLSIYFRWGILGLRITSFIINSFLFLSLYFLIKETLRNIFKMERLEVRLAFFIPVLFLFLYNCVNREMFFWNCTLIGYELMIAIMLCGITCYIRALKNNSIKFAVMAAIMGFIVSGTGLNIVALNCGIYLLVLGFGMFWLKQKKIPIICFSSALIGALLNAIAPGNYARHELATESYDILSSLVDAVKAVYERMNYMLSETPYILICVFLFLLCIHFIRYEELSFEFKFPGLVAFICLAGGVVVNFPVFLGYSTGYFPDRCVFVEDCWLYLSTIVIIGYFAGWCKKTGFLPKVSKELLVAVVISACCWLSNFGILNYVYECPFTAYVKELSSGNAREFATFWTGVLSEIENSEEDVVCVKRVKFPDSAVYLSPEIKEDPNHWVNAAVAAYFDKEAVYIEVEEH